ncbi:MAG: hypothetical protein CMQ41_00370 [Gammaproteobacteria bacterium]|nr:hypothetical protein [Gammaproteobacteria bacterium]|tara:strand:- start:1065 stop:1436 length:372 start_codon:yes stop_codon:yes gene_type:complete
MNKFTCLLLFISLSICASIDDNLRAQEIERVTGLIVADGWLEVQANCTECHSTQLIIQNSGNKAVWESRIRWMQEAQGMHNLNIVLEEKILNYLVENYGQKEASRRAPLAENLLPINPYETVN